MSEKKIKVKQHIIITINGEEIEISQKEAETLYEELKSALNKPNTINIPSIPYDRIDRSPSVPWKIDPPDYPDYDKVWCTTSFSSSEKNVENLFKNGPK